MTWIEWVEPFGPNNEPVYMRVSLETAIASQKAVGIALGKPYPNDEAALEDFCTVHWAQRINERHVEELERELEQASADTRDIERILNDQST